MSIPGGSTVRLAEVLEMRRDDVKVKPDASYNNLGLYSYGRGAFSKPPIDGSVTSASTLFRVHAGQFIYSKLFAFEGAFAVVPNEMDGWFVSSEYPTFDIDDSRVHTDFLALTICRPSAWRGLATMTVGMGHRRQRLQPNAFLDYEVALPSLAEQEAIVEVASTIDRGLKGARATEEASLQFLRALREERLVEGKSCETDPGWLHATLDEVADVALGFTKGRKLTGPTQMMPYLRAVNVQDGFIALDDVASIEASAADIAKFLLRPDDVLLLEGCGSPRLVGRGWIWDGSIDPCLHQNSTLRVRIRDRDRLLPRFLAHAICASPARRHCLESMEQMSVAHLGLAGARSIPIPVPPLHVQHEIVEELDEICELASSAQRKAACYDATKADVVEGLIAGTLRP
jgi:hypothetical protein